MTPPLVTPPLLVPDVRRTSPRIVLVHTVTFKQARQLVPILIPVGAGFGFSGGWTTIVILAVAITVISLAAAALSWWRFSYANGPSAVVLTRGLLSRSVRTVPNDRIRGVEVEAPLLHRLFGLVRVRVDAAAGAAGEDEEVVVDGVPRAEGDRLRIAVLTHRGAPAAADDDEPEPVEEELSRWDNRWLLYAPLVGSYLAIPAAALGALSRVFDDLPGDPLGDVFDVELPAAWALALGVLGGTLLLLVAGSVIGAAIVNWGFRLTQRGTSLVAVRGLFTRRHTELEIDRIRGVSVSEGLGMRLVGAGRATALVTGLADAARRGQLLPLGPRAEAWSLAHRLTEDPGPLVPHPAAARRRRIVRAVVVGSVLTAGGLVLTVTTGFWELLVAGPVITVLGVLLARSLYAALGHAAGPRSFSVRRGWLVREQIVLERRAVIGWQVKQTVFQRRDGLATVTACVGAGSGGYAAVDMDAAEVPAFASAASGGWAGTLTP
ncbi:PH domain-containing protein [Blastococcus sp. LR1]|uniref:PH domain-containing protein n=1 Tax=Blastococcus sp. LR1 TaxID=2877000 RepID=UPI001CCE6C18|nr:PH domain-containing protein [Blastococcus sp. LR1]MCA0145003.1 PH domain-containing protein [Blastococcus sp. LR1]